MKVAGEITAVDGLCGEHRISGGPWATGSVGVPGKTPAWTRAVSGNVVGATLDAALGDLRGHVVKRHMPAKYPVGHGDDDVAGALCLTRLGRRLQQRVDCRMAADQ